MSEENKNVLICGDNLEELTKLDKESVDLIYIDPPFFTHKQYEVIWGDEAETRSFEDRWEGGIEHYIGWLKPRVELMWEILKPTGSFYLHCDWHANAHIRIMLDKIFGIKNFRNEIIWCYNIGGKSKSQWARKHDTIFFYTKSDDWHFDGKAVGFKRETGEKSFGGIIGVDKKGKRYQDKLVKATGKYYRYYLDEPKIPEDWWVDINSIQSQSAERLGYPTQKPEALLERIISASSKKNDLVLDAFCGCGTACVASHKLGRKWIGIDISPTAVKLVEKRLKNVGAFKDKDYIVTGAPKTIKQLKKLEPFEFQNWVINEIPGARHSKKKIGDMGLDGFIPYSLLHPDAGIQVKQSEGVGRNVVDNFKAALDRAKYKKGYIVAFGFGKGAAEEAARRKNEGDVEITLATVEDLLLKKPILK